MNESFEASTVEVTDSVPQKGTESIGSTPSNDLVLMIREFHKTAHKLNKLMVSGDFKFLSKIKRDEILAQLIDEVRACEELTKITYKLAKKIKRENPSSEVLDYLLIEDCSRSAMKRFLQK